MPLIAQHAARRRQLVLAGGTHYDELGVARAASAEQLRVAYQARALALHPDKTGVDAAPAFQRLQAAWQVLREPASRTLYDHALSQAELRATVVLQDELELGDMDLQDPGQQRGGQHEEQRQRQRSHPCRCGDAYTLSDADLALAAGQGELVVPCRSCSNHILVRLPP